MSIDKVSEHEKRSQEIADTTRRFLVGINTGGTGITYGVAGMLAGHGVNLRWTLWPIVFFVSGLVATGVSLLLAKHSELKRRDGAKEGKEPSDFSKLFWRSFTWDIVALALFVVAIITGLLKISGIEIDP